MNAPSKFWIVYSPQGPTPPRVRHDSRTKAIVAAESMAQSHPGQEFFVMEALTLSKSVTVTTLKLETEIPF